MQRLKATFNDLIMKFSSQPTLSQKKKGESSSSMNPASRATTTTITRINSKHKHTSRREQYSVAQVSTVPDSLDTMPTCPRLHIMTETNSKEGAYQDGWYCDSCKIYKSSLTLRWTCRQCQFDMCRNCTQKITDIKDTASDNDVSEDEDMERCELKQRINRLKLEASVESTTNKRQVAISVKVAELEEFLKDSYQYDKYQKEHERILTQPECTFTRLRFLESQMFKLEVCVAQTF